MKLTYRHTLFACYLSYIVQAIVNNLPPLLYVIFQKQLGIGLWQISLLITCNFALQICIDLCSTFFIDRIGYRASILLATATTAFGLAGFALLPRILPDKFLALAIATFLCAVGGGLIEVVVSPTVEALPGDEKSAAMNILHSFYCWGQAGVILLSTAFFLLLGEEHWYILPLLWTAVPIFTFALFTSVPVRVLPTEGDSTTFRSLFGQRIFLILCVLMICSGAGELAMAQWASLFAEEGLHVPKAVGDLLGPCLFAVFMGTARLLFGIFGKRMKFERWMLASFCLGVFSYLLTALSPVPMLSLIGCALCGLSVALLWPGLYSLGAKLLPGVGTLMFALFAFCGDIGCTLGPNIVGWVSTAVENGALPELAAWIGGDVTEAGLKIGMLFAALIPTVGIIFTLLLLRAKKKRK